MRNVKGWFLLGGVGLLFLIAGCGADTSGPRKLLEKFFSSAVQQDYATTYTCYYDAYKAKVPRDEFIKHRKEASVLLSYEIFSIRMPTRDTAEAEVRLHFGPSPQDEPQGTGHGHGKRRAGTGKRGMENQGLVAGRIIRPASFLPERIQGSRIQGDRQLLIFT